VSGPLYKSHSVDGNQVKIEFDHVGGGLKSRDDKPLKRFEISNDGKTWHWATAKIDGDSIVVECSDVSKPVAARYAWAANPEGANLINEEGLPASIFQTK
jgi:sialate O-acetylesterase